MIDFIKVHFQDKNKIEKDIINNVKKFPELKRVLEDRTGEVKYPYRTKLENFEITLSEKSANVKGSLHYYNNIVSGQGNQNHNDFPLSLINSCIDEILNAIPSINDGSITLLEFGFNINTLQAPLKILSRQILNFKYREYNVKRTFKSGGLFKEFDMHDYHFKIYDKGEQFKTSDNILRLELKFTNSKKIRELGVYKLSDLKDKDILKNIFRFFMKRYNELTIIDDFEHVKSISLEEYNAIEKYTNPNFWIKLSDRNNRGMKYRHNKRFEDLIYKYGLNSTKRVIKKLLEDKFNYLINH